MNKSILLFALLFFAGYTHSQTIESVTSESSGICSYDSTHIFVTVSYLTGQGAGLSLVPGSLSTPLGFMISGNIVDGTPVVGSTHDTIVYTITVENVASASISQNAVNTGESLSIDLLDLGVSTDVYVVNNIDLYGDVVPSIDLSNLNLCSNSLPFDLEPLANANPAGGVFKWAGEETNIFDPTELFEFGGGAITYKYTNIVGCSGEVTEVVPFNIPPTVNAYVSYPTSCGSASATLASSAFSNHVPFDVIWSSSETFTQAYSGGTDSIINKPSGTYYVTYVDTNTCISTAVVNVSDDDFTVSATISPQSCENLNDGNVTLNVTPPSGATFTSFWSNGVTAQNMTNSYAGEYSVQLHSDNNCNFFETYEIPDSSINFSLETLTDFDCSFGLAGSVDVSVTGGTGVITIDWTDDTGSSISSQEDLAGAAAGVYTCTITDDVGCSKAWDVTIGATGSNIYLDVETVTAENCGQNNGMIDIDIFSGSDAPTYWQWSNGETTEDLVNVPAGDYTLEYHDINNCQGFITVTVPYVRPYQPSICLLTVDTTLIYNTIIWEKDPSFVVDGWNLYRETSNYGDFELVATIPYADDAMFIDNAASPNNRSWRYYLTSFNGCIESYPSFVHKTIHTVAISDGSGGIDVIWDNYEGINYNSISLMTHSDALGWIESPNVTSPHNISAPDLVGMDFFVKFNLAQSCDPTKAIDHNSSRSNRSLGGVFQPGEETGLTVIENEEGKIMVYPNPTTTILNLYIENVDKFNYFTIVDIQGSVIYQQNIVESYNTIPTDNISSGVYFVQIHSDNNVVIEKVIKR